MRSFPGWLDLPEVRFELCEASCVGLWASWFVRAWGLLLRVEDLGLVVRRFGVSRLGV